MSFQNFWFPSQTGGYNSSAGSLRFNIKYSTGGAATNTDVNVDLQDISDLDLPFEVSSTTQSFRHPSLSLTFANTPYNSTNNKFEQYSILNATYKTKLLIDVYVDGSIFWKGIVDFEKVKRSDYYLDGSTLKYRTIKIMFLDRLAFFWMNPIYALTDISFADYDLFDDTLEAILALADIADTEFNWSPNVGYVSEANGNTYDHSDMFIVGISTSTLVTDFLKSVMLGFACWMYYYKGKFNIVLRAGGASSKAVSTDHILQGGLEKIENANPIEYVELTCTLDWWEKVPFSLGAYENVDYIKTYGNANVVDAKKFVIDTTNLMDFLCVNYAGATGVYPGATVYADAGNDTYLQDTSEDYEANDVESGHLLDYYSGAGNYKAPISDVDADTVHFPDVDLPVNLAYIYEIKRAPGNSGYETYIYKGWKIMEYATYIYNAFYLTSPDVIRLKLRDISEYINIEYKFTIFGNNHRVRSAKITLKSDVLTVELIQVP
jgi:hypothetical protein